MFLGRTTSVSYLKQFVQFEPVNDVYGNKYQMYLRKFHTTMIGTQRSPRSFMRQSKTSFIMRLQTKLLPKLFMTVLIKTKNTWGLLLGKTRPMAAFYNLT